jgi:hypothetical protein
MREQKQSEYAIVPMKNAAYRGSVSDQGVEAAENEHAQNIDERYAARTPTLWKQIKADATTMAPVAAGIVAGAGIGEFAGKRKNRFINRTIGGILGGGVGLLGALPAAYYANKEMATASILERRRQNEEQQRLNSMREQKQSEYAIVPMKNAAGRSFPVFGAGAATNVRGGLFGAD